MRTLFLLVWLALLCAAMPHDATAQPTVIVVRHGEKQDASPDPVLSARGDARATRLAEMLRATKLSATYTTELKRTVMMAAPTAKLLGITSTALPAKDMDALLAKIRAHGKDETVLVVGHSNTVPTILQKLGHTASVVVNEDDYDNLFVLVPNASGKPTVVPLKF